MAQITFLCELKNLFLRDNKTWPVVIPSLLSKQEKGEGTRYSKEANKGYEMDYFRLGED